MLCAEQVCREEEMNILLPWPSKDLSPNARVHWSVRAKAVKIARLEAWHATLQAKAKVGEGAIILHYIFHPPSHRKYDMDNLIARMKGANDGIADALKVDDCRFRLSFEIGEVVKKGQVSITILEN
jgi:crossover junction endodeoxyribonuclease RusA